MQRLARIRTVIERLVSGAVALPRLTTAAPFVLRRGRYRRWRRDQEARARSRGV